MRPPSAEARFRFWNKLLCTLINMSQYSKGSGCLFRSAPDKKAVYEDERAAHQPDHEAAEQVSNK